MYKVMIFSDESEVFINEIDINSPHRLVNAKVSNEINGWGEFEFTIFTPNRGYNLLRELRTEIKVFNEKSVIFEGRVLKCPQFMTKDGRFYKTVVCEGKLAYLCDSVQDFHDFGEVTPDEFLYKLLEFHNENVDKERQIFLGNVNVIETITAQTKYRKTLEEIKENLLENLGGEIKIRTVDGVNYLDYSDKIGVKVYDTKIELGINLQDLNVISDPTQIISRLKPLGKRLNSDTEERLTISAANGGNSYIEDAQALKLYGKISGVHMWDDVDNPAELLEKGAEFLSENNKIHRQFKLTALDLSTIGLTENSFEVGNEYRLINHLLNIDEWIRIVKKTVDINAPQKSIIEIGEKFQTLTEINENNMRELENQIPVAMNAAIRQSSQNMEITLENRAFIRFDDLPNTDIRRCLVGDFTLDEILSDLLVRLEQLESGD